MDYAEAIWTLICFAVGVAAGGRAYKAKIAQLAAKNERLRELMGEASLDDWFCQDNEEWMARWGKALRGE